MKRITLSLLACAAGATASAQSLSGLKLEPATARTGEPVRITATFDNADNPNCNARVHFGDGASIVHSYLDSCEVLAGCNVGPFTHIRPGTRLGEGAKAGALALPS